LVRGELRPGGTEREWCDPDVLRRLRRASLAALRREVEPAEQAALGRFLPSWHGIDRRATLREALIPLQGLPLPVSLWESEVLPRRVPGYRAEQLDQLCASGELVWVGAGLDRVAVFFREDAPVLGQPAAAAAPEGAEHDAIRAALAHGARFWNDLLADTQLEDAVALPALWDLVWAGAAIAALRALARPATDGDAGALGPRGRALCGPARPAGARRAPARTAGNRHARRCARRGHPRRLRRRLFGAAGARDARNLPARLLRRRPRRRAVRARRGRRAAARAAPARRRRAGGARGRRRRSCAAVRRRDPVAEARKRARGARRGRAGRAARRRGGALRRARRPHARAATRPGGRLAARRARGSRRAREARRREAPRGRALRRRARRRDDGDAAARRG